MSYLTFKLSTEMFLVITATVLVGSLTWLLARFRRMSVLRRSGFPGPRPHLLYGHLRELSSSSNQAEIKRWFAESPGETVAYYVGGSPVLLTADIELLKRVQICDFGLFSDRQQLAKGGSNPCAVSRSHIMYAKQKKWKEMRTILTPTFKTRQLKSMGPAISGSVEEMLKRVASTNGNEFDIFPIFQSLSLDVIGKTAFGITSSQDASAAEHPFIAASKKMLAVKPSFLYKLGILFPEFSFLLYPLRLAMGWLRDFAEMPSPVTFVHNFCRAIVQARRQNPGAQHQDLLQQMINAKTSFEDIKQTSGSTLTATANEEAAIEMSPKENPSSRGDKKWRTMTDDEIIGNTFVFLEAGYDTTSTALAFTAHILVNRQDLQEKVRAEAEEVQSRLGALNYETVAELKLLDAVVSETLRLYPPVSLFTTRTASTDYDYNGKLIPEGCVVQAAVFQLHRSPRFWDEPDKFDETRFLGANRGKINSMAWQPFGAGPRNCVGMRLALLEMKLTLARLLLEFDLEATSATEIGEPSLASRMFFTFPRNGVKLRALPRRA